MNGIAPQRDVFTAVWDKAAQLRRSGELLSHGEKITCPVVAIHGDYDPHPYIYRGVEEPLRRVVRDFRFILLNECGHSPWMEKRARSRFHVDFGARRHPRTVEAGRENGANRHLDGTTGVIRRRLRTVSWTGTPPDLRLYLRQTMTY